MLELYKPRDFSSYFSDTTLFFRKYGVDYFKKYFVINGVFLFFLVILLFFLSKFFVNNLYSNLYTIQQNTNYTSTFFDDNLGLSVLLFGGLTILVVILVMLNVSYPIIYLKLLEEKGVANVATTAIVAQLKSNIGKMFVFLLGTFFIVFPLVAIILVGLVLLCFLLIGFPLLFIFGAAFVSWLSLSYFHYIQGTDGYFASLGEGFRMLKGQFWTIVGTSFLMILLTQILQGVVTIIPYMISTLSTYVAPNGTNWSDQNEALSVIGIVTTVVFVFSVLLNFIMNNFILVQQGFIYFSAQNALKNYASKKQIDQIGTDFE